MNKTGSWIVSFRWDLTIFAGPVVLALLLSALVWHKEFQFLPLWAFVLIVIFVDVAHVWATIYRTYLDPVEFKRRRALYILSPLLILGAVFAVHLYDGILFWTVLAYIAIFHFVSQQYGLMAVYKYKLAERTKFDFRLDKVTLYWGAGGPVLWWHAQSERSFDWFGAGENFLLKLPEWIILPVFIFSAAVLLLFCGRQFVHWRAGAFNPGKTLIVLLSWLTWWVGIYAAPNPVVAAAIINLFHGIPFLGLVWLYCNNRFASAEDSPSLREKFMYWLTRPASLSFYIFILAGIALFEEFLWDYYVWHRYLPDAALKFSFIGAGKEIEGIVLSLCVGLLVLPQTVHYFLDGFIWKAPSNPGLLDYLGLTGTQQKEGEANDRTTDG